ncbi:glutathione S-transferase [Acinetobacter gerneri]|uniref:glutathione S-transferase n=1 Tax=Acinetobacter gerneri TaxID=202952 RepID=UPI0028B17D8D|nr:glutathione S-transferase [Acinetobacter gerneri]
MQLTLFHLPNSRSQRIIWLLEELNLTYQLVFCETKADGQITDDLKLIHELGKAPILIIEEYKNLERIVLAETSAITDFLSHRFPRIGLRDLSSAEQLHYFYWKNFAEASLMPNIVQKQVFAQIIARTPFPLGFITRAIKYGVDRAYLNMALEQQLFLINRQLINYPWIAGSEFTVADILLWFPLQACVQANPEFAKFEHIQHYLNEIKSRPAFQHALAKGNWSTLDYQTYWSKAW